jgi:hypothetical protein
MGERVIEQRGPALAARVAHAIESLMLVRAGEAPRKRFLIGGQNVHREMRRAKQHFVHGGDAVHAHEHEWWDETHRAERADRHAAIIVVAIARGEHRDSRREPSEHTPKGVGVDGHGAS